MSGIDDLRSCFFSSLSALYYTSLHSAILFHVTTLMVGSCAVAGLLLMRSYTLHYFWYCLCAKCRYSEPRPACRGLSDAFPFVRW